MNALAAALLAALVAAEPALDTVFLRDGGRVRGTIVEESAARGVTIQLPGGELRAVPADAVARVEYADGSAGILGAGEAPPASGAPAGEAAPEASPSTPAEPLPPGAPPAIPQPPAGLHLFTFGGGLGLAVPGGEAEPGLAMSDVTSPQFLVALGGAIRLLPRLQAGAFLELGIADAAGDLGRSCDDLGMSCTVVAMNVGLQARWVFTPLARDTPWVGIGVATGILSVTPDDPAYEDFAWGGSEPLRLSAGWDYRGTGQMGFGLFVTWATGRYTDIAWGDGPFESIGRTARHTWLQLGVRAMFLP